MNWGLPAHMNVEWRHTSIHLLSQKSEEKTISCSIAFTLIQVLIEPQLLRILNVTMEIKRHDKTIYAILRHAN